MLESQNMKILIATGIFPPQGGGPAKYSKLLFDKLPQYGFEVTVVNFGDVLGFPKIIRHVIYFFRLFLKGFSNDIIFAQDPVSVGLPAMLVSKVLRKVFYLKIVGDYAWEQGMQRFAVMDLLDVFSKEYKKYSFQVKVLKRIELFVANHADQIIVPSEYLKKIVGNWGVRLSKIEVIYNGFNVPEIKSGKDELRKKFNYVGKVIVSPGRLVPWKGFDTVISAFPYILKTNPGVKLVIIGEGPEEKRLRGEVEKFNIEDKVI